MNPRTPQLDRIGWLPSSRTLKQGFAQCPAGAWLAISLDDKRVVGQGATPARAQQQAKLSGQLATLLVRVPVDGSRSAREKHNGHTNGNGNGASQLAALSLPSLYRGIYKRVAHKLGCDPSYVSRVARGERMSRKVSVALQHEIERTLAMSQKNQGR